MRSPRHAATRAGCLAALILFAIGATACGSDDDSVPTGGSTTDQVMGDDTSVSGMVTAPSDFVPADLPAGAQLIVRLEDISLADAPAVVVAEDTFATDDYWFPVGFVLDFDGSDIVDTHSYRVAARVEADGDLLMISDTVVPVITGGAPSTSIEVPLVRVVQG